MPRARTCILGGNEISIETALRLRDKAVRRGFPHPDFRCRECGEAVLPTRKGTTGLPLHFEHWERNPGCSLSD